MHLHHTQTLTMFLLRPTLSFAFRSTLRPRHHHRLRCSSTSTIEISPSTHNTIPLTDFSPLSSNLRDALTRMNITKPTPIQSAAIPLLLRHHDVMASSATGSGKTIMFGLPLVQRVMRMETRGRVCALVIAPTRELAVQISEVLKAFTTTTSKIKVCLATGGSDTKQQRQSLPNCNILVGTPGRIVQFIDERNLSLAHINYLVIDEADRLLDLGFEKELTRISRALGRNKDKQSILCSATFPDGVQRLAADFLDPSYYFVSVGVVGSTHSKIVQRFEWMDLPRRGEKRVKNPRVGAVIRNVEQFWKDSDRKKDQSSVIVFSNTKDGVEEYGKALSNKFGNKKIRVIHGDKEQSQRNKAIDDFKAGRVSLLVATDVAARGLDVTSIGLVIQADAPRNVDTYTHRVGRTGRAGAGGNAVTFIDGKSIGIALGLVDLLLDAGQNESIPAWLRGMAHTSNARSMEEEMQILAGSSGGAVNADEGILNEEFTEQDFRRTAAEGSYGASKDTAYRSFDEEAYNDLDLKTDIKQLGDDITTITETDSDSSSSDDDSLKQAERDNLFHRQKPSQELKLAVTRVNGMKGTDDVPSENVLSSLKNQRLRFEYIGLYPFEAISPLLMNTADKASNDMPKILMVAEKPSIAKAIADALSGNRQPRQRRGISRALPVYEFTTDKFHPINDNESNQKTRCLVRVTSVVGHVYSLGFDFDQRDKQTNPRDYFTLPVTKKEEGSSSKLRVADHLKALAGDSSHLVLWLDCDAEGENIAHEVIAITRRGILSNDSVIKDDSTRRIHRAQFSAITHKALQDAFMDLKEPDPDLSRSVDARQELDLRCGVALTRLLTWKCVNVARKRFSPSTRMISYGPCQTPALSFCVDRLREIENFKAKKYWKVQIEVKLPNGQTKALTWKVPSSDLVDDTRNRNNKSESSATFNLQSANRIIEQTKNHVVVTKVTQSSETISPPVGLNTVSLLEAASKAMGMSPKSVMNVAEKLYSSGYISYPRTETTRYDPNGFDAIAMLRQHASNEEWGKSAKYLLATRKTKKPPKTGRDCGDHPPITPLKSASRGEVGGGSAWRVYEFICRNFIGSLHNDLEFTRTIATLSIPGSDEEFEMELVTVDSLGFADACRWLLRDIGATQSKTDSGIIKEGDHLTITKAIVEEKKQRPPKFLQEFELIREMDSKRIGTDASMAVHVSNIVDREYVILCDETGTPLRIPLPPGKRKQNLPKQIGRYLVPTPLGSSLLNIFGHDSVQSVCDSPALLSHPSIRKQMEEEVKQIARREIEKEACVDDNLDWFSKRYDELERILTRERVMEFGQELVQTKQYLAYLSRLNAFEPKVHHETKVQTKLNQHNVKKSSTSKRMKGPARKGPASNAKFRKSSHKAKAK